MDKCRTNWNRNYIADLRTMNPAEEREACYLTEDSTIASAITDKLEALLLDRSSRDSIDGSRNLPEVSDEQKEQNAAIFSPSNIILNVAKPTCAQEEAAARRYNGGNIIQYAFDEQESSAFHWSADRIIDNSLKLIKEREATTFPETKGGVVQDASANVEEVVSHFSEVINIIIESTLQTSDDEQETARFHCSEDNVSQTALKSTNERRVACCRLSSSSVSQLKRFDKASLAIANKENETNTLKIISDTITDHTNDALYSIDLNPLKRSKALANFKDVDDSMVPYVPLKKQRRRSKDE